MSVNLYLQDGQEDQQLVANAIYEKILELKKKLDKRTHDRFKGKEVAKKAKTFKKRSCSA